MSVHAITKSESIANQYSVLYVFKKTPICNPICVKASAARSCKRKKEDGCPTVPSSSLQTSMFNLSFCPSPILVCMRHHRQISGKLMSKSGRSVFPWRRSARRSNEPHPREKHKTTLPTSPRGRRRRW